MDLPYLRRETRYGLPAADQIMVNRHYVLGYSYYFRQAKWALEIVDPDNPSLDRLDNFRPDYRIPEIFRADLVDYVGSGYHRGHLVASANKIETELQNSETFLLSNLDSIAANGKNWKPQSES
jgi:endonuclease G